MQHGRPVPVAAESRTTGGPLGAGPVRTGSNELVVPTKRVTTMEGRSLSRRISVGNDAEGKGSGVEPEADRLLAGCNPS